MMKSAIRLLAAIAMAMTVCTASAQDEELPIPADEYVYCTVCHGVQLMGNPVIQAPRLSGMAAWYVENQLRSFQRGLRGGHDGDMAGMEMQPMAVPLDKEQISEVAAFVEATRSELPPITVEGDAEAGRALYTTCAACHGPNAEGNIALGSPALTGLNDWYLVTQLNNFKDGSRGGKPGDIYGMQMRASVGLLRDEQAIRDVVSFISTLRSE